MFRHGILLLLALLCLGGARPLLGHEEIDVQVRHLTKRLAERPDDTSLRLRRAELYLRHEDWAWARADVTVLREQMPEHPAVPLLLARIDLGEGRPAACLEKLDDLIALHPDHAAAWFYRGRALVLQGKGRQAAKAFTEGIALLETPRPEHFFERAQAFASEPGAISDAIASLDAGLERLPGNLSLEKRALQLEREAGHSAKALARIERVRSVHGELPPWLIAEGEILSACGRYEEACKAFERALLAVQRLPARRRNVPAMKVLAERAVQGPVPKAAAP